MVFDDEEEVEESGRERLLHCEIEEIGWVLVEVEAEAEGRDEELTLPAPPAPPSIWLSVRWIEGDFWV